MDSNNNCGKIFDPITKASPLPAGCTVQTQTLTSEHFVSYICRAMTCSGWGANASDNHTLLFNICKRLIHSATYLWACNCSTVQPEPSSIARPIYSLMHQKLAFEGGHGVKKSIMVPRRHHPPRAMCHLLALRVLDYSAAKACDEYF